MQEKITVIVPIYKVEKYLNRCVQSITNQTYQNLEIILVDDGSPDECPKMCDEWLKKDQRIKVIHKQNGGLSDARNAGLDVCTGEYITFVDSDDYIDELFIETLYNIAKNNNAQLVACQVKRFNGEQAQKETIENKEQIYDKLTALKNTFRTNDYEFITAWGKLYKAEIFKTLRYPVGMVHEDEFVIHKIFDQITTFAVTNQKLYYYYENPQSITGGIYKLNRANFLLALQDRTEFFKQKYPQLYNEMALYFAYKCIDLYFDVPKNFAQKKQAQKNIKNIFKKAKQYVKGIKSPSQKRFLIFSISPWLYKRVF